MSVRRGSGACAKEWMVELSGVDSYKLRHRGGAVPEALDGCSVWSKPVSIATYSGLLKQWVLMCLKYMIFNVNRAKKIDFTCKI
jgi:hypothetical protein